MNRRSFFAKLLLAPAALVAAKYTKPVPTPLVAPVCQWTMTTPTYEAGTFQNPVVIKMYQWELNENATSVWNG
jgi:hypothetical protein